MHRSKCTNCNRSLDHLVGKQQERISNREAKRLGCLRLTTSSTWTCRRARFVCGMRLYCLSIVRMEPTSVSQCRRERDQIWVFGTS